MGGFIENRSPAFWIFGAIVGLILVAIAALTLTPLGKHLSNRFSENFSEKYIAEKSIDFLISSDGLEETLKQTYADFEVPVEIYDALWLIAVHPEGTGVTFTYEFTAEFSDASDVFDPTVDQEEFCAQRFYEHLMAYGASFTNTYVTVNEAIIGSVTVDAAACGIALY